MDIVKGEHRGQSCQCGTQRNQPFCCEIQQGVVSFPRQHSYRQAGRLIGVIAKFAGSSEVTSVRERAAHFFQLFYLEGNEAAEEDWHAFWDWFVFDFSLEGDRRLLHWFMEGRKAELTAEDMKMLQRWCFQPFSLYRVKNTFPGRGIQVEDLLRGGEMDVISEMTAAEISPGSLLVVRLLPLDEEYTHSPFVFVLPPFVEEELKKVLQREMSCWLEEGESPAGGGAAAWHRFLLERSHVLFSTLRSLRNRWERSLNEDFSRQLDNQDLLVAVTTFYIRDYQGVLEILRGEPSLVPLRNKKCLGRKSRSHVWEWRGPCGKAEVSGYLRLTRGCLVLECFERKALEEGRELVNKLLEGFVFYRQDGYIDLLHGLQAEPDFPLQAERYLHQSFSGELWREWIHTPLPEQEGRTPFQLRMEEGGRIILEEIIKNMEQRQSSAAQKKDNFLDLHILRRTLFLESVEEERMKAEDYRWEGPVCKRTAELLEHTAEALEFTPCQLANSLRLWHDFVQQEKPMLKKPEAWAGAVAYLVSFLERQKHSQRDIAALFHVSGRAVSANSARIRQALDLDSHPELYSTLQRCYADY